MKWEVAAIVLAIGIVGRMDYEDEKRAEQRYVEMVCSDLWPDYKDRQPECN